MSLPCSSVWDNDAMSWSVEFLPFVPWPRAVGARGCGRSCCSRCCFGARAAARSLRAARAIALLLLAIANPQLKQEDREPLNDVLAVVVDDSQSQAIAGRTGAHQRVAQGARGQAQVVPQSRRALGAFGLDLGRQRARRHHAVHRSRPGPVRRAARPAGRRDHDHRRRGARRARFRRRRSASTHRCMRS